MKLRPSRRAVEQNGARQRGVAAIEFALVFSVLFLAVYGVITFGGVLYVQQVISRAAEDGARAVQFSQTNAADETLRSNVQSAIYRSLSLSSITPVADSPITATGGASGPLLRQSSAMDAADDAPSPSNRSRSTSLCRRSA